MKINLQFPWKEYINSVFFNRTKVLPDEKIIVPTLKYLKKMMDVVRKTPKRYKERFKDILRLYLVKILSSELVNKIVLITESRDQTYATQKS